jgi:hypothetical protein
VSGIKIGAPFKGKTESLRGTHSSYVHIFFEVVLCFPPLSWIECHFQTSSITTVSLDIIEETATPGNTAKMFDES